MPGVGVEQEKQTAQGAMEISVSRQELLRELTATQSVVERKTTIPILSNFLIEAADDKLTITGTDLDQSMKTSCPAKVKKPGACTIPARKLYDYIKLLEMEIFPSSCLKTTGCRSAQDVPIPRWSAWRAQIFPRCQSSRKAALQRFRLRP